MDKLRIARSHLAYAKLLGEGIDAKTTQAQFERICHEVLGLVTDSLHLIRQVMDEAEAGP